MSAFLDIAKMRYSSRSYKQTPVEQEKLHIILEAARIAPSAANRQPYIFYVVREEKLREQICSTYHREWLKNAPVIIVCCVNKTEAWTRNDGKNHGDIDLAIAVDHMTLQAAELGLATCWICNFDTNKCRNILELPENIEPVVLLPIAYPADTEKINIHLNNRKNLESFVYWK
ncbi:MAG: nitroreductase family protein [Bacteroidales bacterium]|nr:nitroreductase family protein [Bacteroidales bacterium]